MTHKQYQVERPGNLNWVAPTYHDIKWPKRQAMPSPHREIEHNEFFLNMFANTHSLKGIYYAQLYLPEDSEEDPYKEGYPKNIPQPGIEFFWYPDFGLAIAKWYTHKDRRLWPEKFWVSKLTDTGYGYEFRFFRVGCEHDYAHENPRMHEHRYTCKKCDYTFTQDSSG